MRVDKEDIKQEIKRSEFVNTQILSKYTAVKKMSQIPDSPTKQLTPKVRSAFRTRTSSNFFMNYF